MNQSSFLFFILFISCLSCQEKVDNPIIPTETLYNMPDENQAHEGTWLQWPHHYQLGKKYRERLDDTWVSMTRELVNSEMVHLVAYNETEKARIIDLLNAAAIPMTNIDFHIYPTDDVWVRDNGPIYVRDSSGNLLIEDWGFNGWGCKAKYKKCNIIPYNIATTQSRTRIDLNEVMTIEGGAVEIDGHGTLLATKSAILNKNRNKGMTVTEAEAIFKAYLGIHNVIWLEGVAGLEITDMHIDGFARFGDSTTIVTMSPTDLLEWEVPQSDIDILYTAKNVDVVAYNFLIVPLTQNNVLTTDKKDLGYKGSYANYYVANTKVLVPNYNDPNDSIANAIIQSLYPNRTVVGIDVRNLYENGGMIHCVTQQQPKE